MQDSSLVEDDVHLLQGIKDILEIEGYRVDTAASGVDGLDALNRMATPPDLIISDIMMPRMDGYQFFEAVRSSDKWLEIPFVFLTAKGEKHDVRLGRRLGADEYVIKPMDPEDLLVIVDAKLRRREDMAKVRENQISEIKRNILTILNHEFRTPLTYMVAYSDMLNSDAENLGTDELRLFLRGVNSGADRFRRLVENFISLVELETGEASQNYRWRSTLHSNLTGLCAELTDMTRLIAEEKQITVEMDVPSELPPFMADHELPARGAGPAPRQRDQVLGCVRLAGSAARDDGRPRGSFCRPGLGSGHRRGGTGQNLDSVLPDRALGARRPGRRLRAGDRARDRQFARRAGRGSEQARRRQHVHHQPSDQTRGMRREPVSQASACCQ
jgi:CheY-like chemotaxis protein